jgi:hypothetical protein
MKLPRQNGKRRPLTAEEAQQWHVTARLAGVALGLAVLLVCMLARRYWL